MRWKEQGSSDHAPERYSLSTRLQKTQRLCFNGGDLSLVVPNTLAREFEVNAPYKVWVTDFTYIRTHEGQLYLAIVLDLFNRQVIGWSMKNNPGAELVIDALMKAI